MTPCGKTRREFLWQTGAGFTGVALASLLAEDGFLGRARAEEPDDPLAPKRPHFAPRAKRVIFLFMYGGPSQVDLFDPKPALKARSGKTAELEVRKGAVGKVELLGSNRTFAPHGRSGIEVSDLLPNLAGCVDGGGYRFTQVVDVITWEAPA